MIQKHWYYFGDDIQKKFNGNALNSENWDILRVSSAYGPFSIENTVDSYEKNCMLSDTCRKTAEIIIKELEKTKQIKTMVSMGAGKGTLEWHIKKLNPEIRIECTDYTSAAIERLKTVFTGMDSAYTFDMLNDDYGNFDEKTSILLNRVSTEFDPDQWNNIFFKMYNDGVKNIIFIPTELATIKDIIREKLFHAQRIITGKKDVFCGWLYSEREFLKMFSGSGPNSLYSIENRIPFQKTAIYFLKRIDT